MNKKATWAAAMLAACAIAFAQQRPSMTVVPPQPLTLDEAVETAVRQNPNIINAEQEIQRTRGVVLEVQAQAFPQVTIGNGFTQTESSLLGSAGGLAGTSTTGSSSTTGDPSSMGSSKGSGNSISPMTQSWNMTVTMSQLIYSGGQVNAAIHIAKYTQDATIYSLRDVVDTTIANVRSEFYAVLLDRAIIEVQEENINLLESQLKDQQNRFDAGTVPQFNVLQAEVALANARPQLIQARNDYNVALLNLARTLGMDKGELGEGPPAIYPVGDLTTDEKPGKLAEALQLAQERRPFLKEQREQIMIQVENIKVALAGYQPRLTADGGYEVRNNEASKSLTNYVTGWFFGFTGTWDIWNSGETYGQVKQAKAQLEEAKATYDDAVRQVDVEVQQALDQTQVSEDTIVSQEKAIEEAQEALRLAQERLVAGAGTQLDVLSAQVALTQSRTTLVQAQYNYNIAMAQFDQVTAANTRWQELFQDPLVARQRAQEGLPNGTAVLVHGTAVAK